MIYIVPFFFEDMFSGMMIALRNKDAEEEEICRINMQCMWRR